MSARRPYIVLDDDDDENMNASDSELELLDYDSSELEVTGFTTKTTLPASPSFTPSAKNDEALKNGPIRWPDSEMQRYKFNKGSVIVPGDTVEMKDYSGHAADSMHSADFLRVKHIIINLQTDEVRLRGHRLRRVKYLGQIFDWKLNEVAMVLRVNENDTRCPFVAGMEDIPIEEIICPRLCVLTNKPYPCSSFRRDQGCAFPASLSKKEVKQQIFYGGRLACRVVYTLFVSKNGKPYSGIVRRLYAKEADTVESARPTQGPGSSRIEPIPVDDDGDKNPPFVDHNLSGFGKKRAQSDDTQGTKKRRSPLPTKEGSFTFGDVFCGAGGASQGAWQAGLHIKWGLDNDEDAISAYGMNHPGALPFRRNAHNFPPRGHTNDELRVDVLHLSPPCCFFSPAHTINGQNDQANLEAIYTVGPILNMVRPRIATLEQTFGLVTHTQHKANFLMLLRDIGHAGYDMRYRIQDLSEYGLAQQRKRLLIIAARHGTPLPHFPARTHGGPGSGLIPWQCIEDALVPIQRLALRPTDDQYHQPKHIKNPQDPHSPRTFLKGCITTDGGTAYHYSGTRKYTPRELSLLQTFPIDYKFSGTQTAARKQIGNAFPPIMAEAMYRTIAKTLEAFDKGYIKAEDDLSDLDRILDRKGAALRQARPVPRAVFNPPARATSVSSLHFVRDNASTTQVTLPSSRFGRKKDVLPRTVPQPQQMRDRGYGAFRSMGFSNRPLDGIDDREYGNVLPSIEGRPRRPYSMVDGVIREVYREVIEVSSESENESETDSD